MPLWTPWRFCHEVGKNSTWSAIQIEYDKIILDMHRHITSLVWQSMMNQDRLFDSDSIFPASRYITMKYQFNNVQYEVNKIPLQSRLINIFYDEISYCVKINGSLSHRLLLRYYHSHTDCHAIYVGVLVYANLVEQFTLLSYKWHWNGTLLSAIYKDRFTTTYYRCCDNCHWQLAKPLFTAFMHKHHYFRHIRMISS